MNSNSLIAHWPLTEDASDQSGGDHDGKAENVVFGGEGAVFNGRDSVIEVDHASDLDVFGGDFSIAVRIHTESDIADTVGDILSKFDPASRHGLTFCVKNNDCGPHNPPNHRHLHLGVDDGSEPGWEFHGRPGNSRHIHAFCVHRGDLYAGSHETDVDACGHLFRYDGGETWEDCGNPDGRNSLYSMASLGGALYVTTACGDLVGSQCPPSKNLTPGGSVYRRSDEGEWIDCGNPYDAGRTTLAIFKGSLLAKNIWYTGVYEYKGEKNWELIRTPNVAITSLAAFNGHLYGSPKRLRKDVHPDAVHPDPYLPMYRHDGTAWRGCAEGLIGQIYGFTTHQGQLFCGTWPWAVVYRSATGLDDWVDCGGCGLADHEGEDKGEIMGMAVYNGKLYVGTLPLAEVYRYDGDRQWTHMTRLDFTPDVLTRRAWSMAEAKGRLWVGTLPSGEVHSMETGLNAMTDTELDPGWRHLAATRDGGRLRIYVDGEEQASSRESSDELDARNTEPLRIGFGATDYFCGVMRDMQLYGRALSSEDIRTLAID